MADPLKIHCMSVDPVSIHGCPVKRIEGIRKFGVQVENAAAFRADKVIMTAGIGIEVIHTVPKPESCDLTEVSKQRQASAIIMGKQSLLK